MEGGVDGGCVLGKTEFVGGGDVEGEHEESVEGETLRRAGGRLGLEEFFDCEGIGEIVDWCQCERMLGNGILQTSTHILRRDSCSPERPRLRPWIRRVLVDCEPRLGPFAS